MRQNCCRAGLFWELASKCEEQTVPRSLRRLFEEVVVEPVPKRDDRGECFENGRKTLKPRLWCTSSFLVNTNFQRDSLK